jgi:folate-binding protein YgfZ
VTTKLIECPDHGVVVVRGPDATSFLQSLVSQDLDAVTDGNGAHSLLLSPQGKLEVDFRALRVADEWWLDCDPGFGARFTERLGRYRIRVDVTIEDRTAGSARLEVRGPEAAARVAAAISVDVPDANHSHTAWGACRVVRADWSTMQGVDIVGPGDEVRGARDLLLAAGIEPFAPGAYEVVRIDAGVPRLGVDIDGATIPQEAFLERDAVSFTKGCFLGQELVCRIDSRGHVNRFLRHVDVEGSILPDVGAPVVLDDREVGVLTSIAPVADGTRAVGLAMVRREVELPAPVTLRGPGGEIPATVAALPATDEAVPAV